MDGGVVGLVLVILAALLSRRFPWLALPARVLQVAALLFAFGLVAPVVSAMAGEPGWVAAGALGVAVGFLLLVLALVPLVPSDGNQRSAQEPPSAGKRSVMDRVEDPFE